MLYKSHKVVGLATAAGLAVTYNYPVTFGGFVMVLIGSGLPDIDNSSSKIGRLVPIISNHIPHRGITHSIYVIIACIYGILYTQNNLIIGLSIGIICHIIADMFSTDGLDLFLTHRKIYMPIHYKVDGKVETVLRLMAWIILFYYIYQLSLPLIMAI